jgi:predicted ATP-binding protein involved in virulence
MKLKNVQITNFRCFESLSLDLDEQLTVLVAKNGQGKSSILDAIRIGLWSFVSGFDLARSPANDSANNISIEDVRILKMQDGQMARQLPSKITLRAEWNTHDIQKYWLTSHHVMMKSLPHWTRCRDSEVKDSKTKDDLACPLIEGFASFLQSEVRNAASQNILLPIVGYYGTGRLWSQNNLPNTHKLVIRENNQNKDMFMRLFAYSDCLNPSSSYKNFEDWFIWIFECYREEQIRQAEKGVLHENNPKWKETILVVQQAINDVLQAGTGWRDLEYSVSDEKSLILNHPDYGKLKVEQLSDGIRGILAMVGDIAYRCVKLNWHLGANAAKETHGVVMIDEIEMHLHPAWQQSILGNLCKAFPNIQFIVTTHSPQVLSTVPSHQIRVLDEGQVHSASAGIKGAEVSRILKQVFGVNSRPQNDPNTQLLNEYLDLVYKDKWNEAKEQRTKLDAIYQGNEPALTEADLYIENRQWELEIEENQ